MYETVLNASNILKIIKYTACLRKLKHRRILLAQRTAFFKIYVASFTHY
jgi:hypothetical protein